MSTARIVGQDAAGEFRVPLMERPPRLHGHVKRETWHGAAGFDTLASDGVGEARGARVYVGATRTELCVAVVSETHPDSGLLPGDEIEIWVAPNPAGKQDDVFRIAIDSAGRDSKTVYPQGRRVAMVDDGHAAKVRVRSAVHEGRWHCQVILPAAAFGRDNTTQAPWSINVCRVFQKPHARPCLSGGNASVEDRVLFRFADEPCVAVQFLHAGNPFDGWIEERLFLFNPGGKPVRLFARLALRPARRTDMAEQAEITIAAGESRQFDLPIEALAANHFELSATVNDQAGNCVYSRSCRYSRVMGKRWELPPAKTIPLDFRFGYYPYRNRMRIKADISGLPENARLKSVDFIIRQKGGRKPVRKFSLRAAQFSRGVCETSFTLPPLQGKYEIAATATGRNVPAKPLVKRFERNRFEWEHNNLGKSRTVYPPFKPIEVKGNTLHTVLKEYEMNRLGLLDRVATEHSEGLDAEEILAKPMRYSAIVDGRKVTAKPASFSFKSRAPDRAVAVGAFSLGPVRAKMVSALEYDGMLRVDLTLLPSPRRKVQKLDLEIPMRGRVARMIHAISCRYRDGAEFAALPAGQGVIWSAADLPPVGWEENVCNYIFLGDGNRGLCWFTENDRGWSRKTGDANLDVVRRGDDVILRIHFVSAPVEITKPRTITFGLLAAPVKPRLHGWRHRWHTDSFNVLGCDHHWGAPGCCGSVYPAGRNMLIWKAIRRANREVMSDREIESVIARCWNNYLPYGKGSAMGFATLMRRNLRNRHGKRMIFYYNRSSEPLCEEFRTFMDEWGRDDYNDANRGKVPIEEVMVVPSESFMDYTLHWYAKSFEIAGNTGIYMDNIFFAHTLNTEMTGAYRRDDGSISRSNGIWHLREQAKRTFQFMNERGMEPIHMAHMTSLEILPILSFYTVQYDWEWQRERGDMHRRYTREYLQLVSSGEHSGTWPTVLHEQRKLERDPWTLKTAFGVTIVHEIIIDPHFWHGRPIGQEDVDENRLFNTFLKPLHDIGRKPRCEVYRYWDARPQPVKATDPDLPTIVFSRKGIETIFAITSFAAEDKTADVTLDAGTLGFVNGCRVFDMESGDEMPVRKGHVRFPLKTHDLREFRIVPLSLSPRAGRGQLKGK